MDNAKYKVLIVDDVPDNIHVLVQCLKRSYSLIVATNGEKALSLAETTQPDIILLDIMMPGMDGYEVCRRLKASETTRNIPVIFLTALTESGDETRGLALGAVDYIAKPFNIAILKARLGNQLALRQAYKDLENSQRLLAEDLAQAAEYVASQLPPELTHGPVRTQWRFAPALSLGGDGFGYHFIDEGHFAFFLLDVCNHGIGPALLSVQVMNALKSRSLPDVDFCDPSQTLNGLNDMFQMDRHNGLYFTMMYGVYALRSRTLTLAGAGHPPALLYDGEHGMRALKAQNIMVGALPELDYQSQSVQAPPGSTLLLFSDGVYEVVKPEGDYWTFNEYEEYMAGLNPENKDLLDVVLANARSMSPGGVLEDDFSMLKITFA
jgi:sigma-B regulation protein RsbU (phosphoserine phosphatase)